MPIPNQNKIPVENDGFNKLWEIYVGKYLIRLWAGRAEGSFPQNPNLYYDEYQTFHFRLYEFKNQIPNRRNDKRKYRQRHPDKIYAIPDWHYAFPIYVNRIRREHADELYDFLCEKQGIISEDYFIISTNTTNKIGAEYA